MKAPTQIPVIRFRYHRPTAASLKTVPSISRAYTMKYAGSSVTLSTTAQVAKTAATAGVFNESSNVEISYTGKPASQMVQGTYSDTVTFEIAAN